MAETIYTIPINEAFDKKEGCPLCALTETLEQNELTLILGASMMEPDVRIATNRLGFCPDHLEKMLDAKKKLPLALMLQSRLEELRGWLDESDSKKERLFAATADSCYICARIERYLSGMYENLFWLYSGDEAFREKVAAQKGYCLKHFSVLYTMSEKRLKSKDRDRFRKALTATQKAYYDCLAKDVDSFTAMFDYRNAGAEWGDFRDAPERICEALGLRR